MTWLAKINETAYDGTRGVDLVRQWMQKKVGLFRIGNGPVGIAACSIEQQSERVLRVLYLAGSGLVKARKGIMQDLHEIKEQEKCDSIDCYITSPALHRLYLGLGFTQVAIVMRTK